MTRRKFTDAELAAFPVSKQKAIQRQRRHVERKAKQQTEHARNAPGGLLPDQRLDAVESDVVGALNGEEAQIFRLTKDELEAVGKWRPSLRFIAATYCRATAALLHNGPPSASLIAQQISSARMLGLEELPTAKKRTQVSDRFKF
jgi:hypothetical protein